MPVGDLPNEMSDRAVHQPTYHGPFPIRRNPSLVPPYAVRGYVGYGSALRVDAGCPSATEQLCYIWIWLLREVNPMLCRYTAKYTRLADGYMGQLVEWPEVVTEGADLEECRTMLRDALREMVLAYRDLDKEIPSNDTLIEPLAVEIDLVGEPA